MKFELYKNCICVAVQCKNKIDWESNPAWCKECYKKRREKKLEVGDGK